MKTVEFFGLFYRTDDLKCYGPKMIIFSSELSVDVIGASMWLFIYHFLD